MYVAELSAINLGDFVEISGVKRGNRWRSNEFGILTEVKHNSIEGTTHIRLSTLNNRVELIQASIQGKEKTDELTLMKMSKAVKTRHGTMISYPFGQEITKLVSFA